MIYATVKTLLRNRRIQTQFTSSQFVLSAGAVSFQFVGGAPKKVLLVHQTRKNQWLLAKGRKDQGEGLATAAVREVFEETGYRCHLHPVPRLPTRAPLPTTPTDIEPQSDIVRICENGTEPFAITLRPTGVEHMKLIFWFIGAVDLPQGEQDADNFLPDRGTHMNAEGFGEARLFPIDEALQMLTFIGDRELVRNAVDILS
ncbi:hypothetical protein C2E23DRAFT_357052 [Lenzites betulinus]|nr:hypothetical protein C2E23DRAFT_357052 [Lenzites betulinus]